MPEHNEKILIEKEFGLLWSGVDSLLIGDKVFTAMELKRAFDLWAADIVGIDLHSLTDGQYAFRFYDGDDRCIVVFVFDEKLDISRELRAHIAEWLEEDYYGSGMESFYAGKMVKLLHRKVRGKENSPPG
ncbi:MAG: hypothetical protein HW408_1097 [Actinobacteria bacterium]|nr:hypothetical protein [Actinomycetota bacterium]